MNINSGQMPIQPQKPTSSQTKKTVDTNQENAASQEVAVEHIEVKKQKQSKTSTYDGTGLREYLLEKGILATKEAETMAQYFLENNIEITKSKLENALNALTQLVGKKGVITNQDRFTVASWMRLGFDGDFQSLSILNQYFKDPTKLSEQLQVLLQKIHSFKGKLGSSGELNAAVSYCCTKYQEMLEKYKSKFKNNDILLESESLIDDTYTLKQFISGLAEKQDFKHKSAAKAFVKELDVFLKQLLPQHLLSQEDLANPNTSKDYCEIPNMMGVQYKNTQILFNYAGKRKVSGENQVDSFTICCESDTLGNLGVEVKLSGDE